jgi:hypothetical protein
MALRHLLVRPAALEAVRTRARALDAPADRKPSAS